MSVVAWIGLGAMGGRMSAHLVAAGHRVLGLDVVPALVEAAAARGIEAAGSVADAVREADVVVLSLPRGEHVRQVLDGADGVWAHARPGTLVLDTSTVDVATSRWCHEESAARGHRFVDAPVSGGVSGAEAGTLAVMLGGEERHVADATHVVAPFAGSTIHVGPATHGIAAKLVNNMMLGIGMLAVSEGSQLAKHLGLDPHAFWRVASVSSGDSWPLRTWYPVPGIVDASPANRGFEPGYSTDLAEKDLSLAVAGADETGVHVPAARIVLEQLRALQAEGLGGMDCTLVARFASPDGTLEGYDPA
ncbi:NAD(P)-dependent oxidoreductase [Agrococcus sp. SGAir0287]|uniref:NAD(P)-dependent oxidoreductase n=1 Tax=Agrococcus sp. SGAir0287 TaxID=2070347 RepID=UPI0010CCD23E|nr:prephenate dehydrogenase/arogenate dehydrogenase family protein [Agrococcus sp. SGAir0287]QCR19364.1 3-hydroxyisobutyrate dehydrogenase [Agrococcus sp. SGAir0287]